MDAGLWVADDTNAYLVDNSGNIIRQFQLNSPSGTNAAHRSTDIAIMPNASYMFGIKANYNTVYNYLYPLVLYDPVAGTPLKEFTLLELAKSPELICSIHCILMEPIYM